MRRRDLLWLLAAAAGAARAQPLPAVQRGRIERLPGFASKHVDARHVDVWLPAGYSPARPCRVLYMHDGQMLFDAATTWNKQAWNVDAALQPLIDEHRVAETLVVGIWNNGELRRSEYYPQKFLAYVPEPQRASFVERRLAGRPRADAYLRFLVEELKPAIDRRFATRPGRADTAVMGSSMGGLVSIYALCEYPQVFGAAAGLSTHWVGDDKPNAALPLAAFQYLAARLPDPAAHRLYMDRGSEQLDALYAPYQPFVDEIVRERGYGDGQAMLRVFPGTGHNERDWGARVALPLEFLLRA